MANLNEIFGNVKNTENGDMAFKSTMNPLIDILFMSEYYQKHINEVKLGDTPLEKLFAMFMRDPRFGMGRRDLGRELMYQAKCDFDSIVKAGRFDDILYKTDEMSDEDFAAIAYYMYAACNSGNALAKKWMPRYSSKNLMLARRFAKAFGLNKQQYGKFVKVETTESNLSQHAEDNINFEHVPSLAMMKYYSAFKKKNETAKRFAEYLDAVKKGEKKLNVATSTVYDIYKNCEKIDPQLFFDKIKKISGSWIPVVDTSGSMMDGNDSFGKALAIGHYLAKCSTYAPGQVISFSSRPQLITLGDEPQTRRHGCWGVPQGNTQWHKEIRSMYTGDCSNTDFGAVMRLLKNLDPANAPEYIVVLSDMEFDCGSSMSKDDTMRMFKENGINTKIIWWNLNSRNTTCPETDTYGNIFMSGYSPMLLEYLETGFNAEDFLMNLLKGYVDNIMKAA